MNSIRAAVVSHVVRIQYSVAFHNRSIHISVVDDRFIHPHHSGVIGKHAAPPLAARKTDSAKAESVIDAAVVTHFVSPVAIVESILTAVPAPVRGGPKRAFVRSRYPGPRHPVVVAAIV